MVPGTSGNHGLSIVVVKFAGSIAGEPPGLGTADGVEADAGVGRPAPADDVVAAGEPTAVGVDVGFSAAGASVRPVPIAEQPASSSTHGNGRHRRHPE